MLRGKIAKRPKEARKGLSPNLRGGGGTKKNLQQIYQQKKSIKNKINLLKSTPLSNAGAQIAHTHTETKQNKTKTKHQKQAKLQKSKSVTYLHYWEENMLSFSCFLNVLTLRVRTVAKRHMGSSMFTPSVNMVSCVKLP